MTFLFSIWFFSSGCSTYNSETVVKVDTISAYGVDYSAKKTMSIEKK